MRSNTINRFTGNQAYWPLPLRSSQKSAQASWKVQLRNLFRSFVAQLTDASELRVWKSHDGAGDTLWNAYDSVSNRVIRNASETELRVWLETRYQF